MLTLTIPEKSGICRWCGCTYLNPCAGGCAWANRTATLCTDKKTELKTVNEQYDGVLQQLLAAARDEGELPLFGLS